MSLTSVVMPHDDFSRLHLFQKFHIELLEITPIVSDNKEWTPGDPNSTTRFLSLCRSNNIKPNSVHSFFLPKLGHDVADKNPNVRKKAIELNKKLLRGAGDVGANYIVAHLYGWDVKGRSEDESMSLAKEVIAAYLPEAERTGVKIAVENLILEWSVKQINQLVYDFNHPLLGICFDTGHAALYGDVEKELRLCGSRLIALHIHDNSLLDDDHLVPFRGKIDWKAFASALVATGYKGPLTLESYVPEKGESFENFLHACRRAYEKLTEFILEEME